jgi:hypothetical protein
VRWLSSWAIVRSSQFGDQAGYVFNPDRGDPARAQSGQDVVVEVEAVGLVGARVTLTRYHHRLEALAPSRRDGVEAQSRRGRHPARFEGLDQILAGAPGSDQVGASGAEVKAPTAAGADRELAVRLAVDAALDAGAARLHPGRHRNLRS